MKFKLILGLALISSSVLGGQPFHTEPPSPGSDLPGNNIGKIETYWLAPYVRVSKGFGGTTVTWFDPDGRVKRQSAVSGIEPGFVDVFDGGEKIIGVNEDWEINLPPEGEDFIGLHEIRELTQKPPNPLLAGYITSTPDSRVFIHEYHPTNGQVALDIYLHGKFANTVGPFLQYQGSGVALNDDGSANLVIWENKLKTNAQTVTLDSNGQVVPTAEAQSHSKTVPDLGPNPLCVGQIPGTHESLIWTSFGFETNRYHLIDQGAGKQLWDIACPGGGQPLAIGLTPQLVIFSVAELYGPGGPWRGSEWVFLNSKKDWVRTFYAINVQNGQTIARWQEDYPRRYCDSDYGHFLWLKNELFYVTPDEFTKLNFEDILAKKNGWH